MSVSGNRAPPALFVSVVSAFSLSIIIYAHINGFLSSRGALLLLAAVAVLLLFTLLSSALFIIRVKAQLKQSLAVTSKYESIRGQMEVLSAIREVSLLTVTEMDRGEIACETLNILAEPLEARRMALLVPSTETGKLIVLAVRTDKHSHRKNLPLKEEEYEAAVEAYGRMRPFRVRTRRGVLIAYPFGGDEGARGVLLLLTKNGAAERSEKRVFHMIRAVSLALRMPALYERAVYDALTGLFTRRHLNRQLPMFFEEARRRCESLSVVMLDIDHFKRLNDTYGHLFGDEVLLRVASSVKQSIRSYDTAYRYGGEEICIILPRTGADDAFTIARRCHEKIAEERFRTDDGEEVSVTVSVGVAALNDTDVSAEILLKRVDEALYRAKRSGRNRIVCAEPLSRE